ncbi:MAG: HAMP domain-containing sensor histidine kinase [Chitinophagales bacterium]
MFLKILEKLKQYLLPAFIAVLLLIALFRHPGVSLPEAQHNIEKYLLDFNAEYQKGLSQIAKSGIPKNGLITAWNVWQNDSLVQYTSNETDFNTLRLFPEGDTVIRLKNGWYFLQNSKRNDLVIAALSCLKYDYRFENNFLKNNFSEALQIPAQFAISESELKGALPVHHPNGKVLFWIYADETRADRQSNVLLFAVYFLLLVIGCYYLNELAVWICEVYNNRVGVIFLCITVVLARSAMIYFKFPAAFYDSEIFDSSLYATAFFAESLGDLALSCGMLLWLVAFPFLRSNKFSLLSLPPKFRVLEQLYLLAFQYVAVGIILWLLKSMVLDSTISFEVYNVLSLTGYSVVGLFCMGLMLTSHFILSVRAFRKLIALDTNLFTVLFGTAFFGMVFTLCFYYLPYKGAILYTTAWCCVFATVGVKLFQKNPGIRKLEKMVVFVLLYSALSMYLIETLYERKERNQREFFAGKLAAGHDYIAEYSFNEIATRIENDRYIKSYFNNPVPLGRDLHDRLVSLYFSGYFNKYDIHLSSFDAQGKGLHRPDSSVLNNWVPEQTENNVLYYRTDSIGSNYYVASLQVRNDTELLGTLYLKLIPKLYNGQSVYPELLLSKNMGSLNAIDYNFAIYQHDKLVVQHGDYPYSYYWDPHFNSPSVTEQQFLETKDWEHLICSYPNDRKVVVSVPQEGFFEPVATLSYFFVLYFMVISLLLTAYNLFSNLQRNRTITEGWLMSFRTRINSAMMIIIAISFVVVGFVTISFFTHQYDAFYTDRLLRKEKAILADVEYFIQENFDFKNNNRLSRSAMEDLLNIELVKLSQIHNIDINLYDDKGDLAVSSQPEIFEDGLIGKKIHPHAWQKLFTEKETQFTQQENIGTLSYTASYAPVRNLKGETVAFLGVPYFEKSKTIRDEVSSFLVTLINAYVFLLLCAAAMAYFISNSITRPLRFISEKFRLLNLTQRNEPIEWNSRDEIGVLISEYNKMITQLEGSAQKLAKSERESAWREMARQIAHEIKNPLTPMKLSIQYLQRAIDEDHPNVPEMARKVSKTLIEQIENLNTIATAFSSFAQVPRSNNEVVNLNELLEGIIALFDKEEQAEIQFENYKENAFVFADRSQLHSVFINLLKNAIQSIPEDRHGKILVIVLEENGFLKVVVIDNGVGISRSAYEKVFAPNFTTKSSGTGLGLAIAKQILENANGKIWFESEEGNGTTFYVTLPSYQM